MKIIALIALAFTAGVASSMVIHKRSNVRQLIQTRCLTLPAKDGNKQEAPFSVFDQDETDVPPTVLVERKEEVSRVADTDMNLCRLLTQLFQVTNPKDSAFYGQYIQYGVGP
jgi:hypothetical protein